MEPIVQKRQHSLERYVLSIALMISLWCLFSPIRTFAQAPYINSISTNWMNPVRVPNSWSSVDMTINGGNFTANSIVRFSDPSGGWVNFSESVISRTANSLTVRFSPPAQTGEYFVEVEDNSIRSGKSAFGVVYGAPDISAMTPSSGNEGESVTIEFGGGSLLPGITQVVSSPAGISGVINSNRRLTFTAPPAGTYWISLVNPTTSGYGGGGTSWNSRGFTSNAVQPNPAPTVVSVNQSSPAVGSASSIGTANCTGIITSSQVRIIAPNGQTAPVSWVTPNAAQQTVNWMFMPEQYGTYSLEIVNPAPGGGTVVHQLFTLTAPAPSPVITSNPSPSSVEASPNGNGSIYINLSGQNFANDMTATFNNQPVSIISRIGSNYVTINVPASLYTQPGQASITLTNPPSASGGGGSTSVGFAITAPVIPPAPSPVITSNPSPSSVEASADGQGSLTITLSGYNFASNITATFRNTPVNVAWQSASQVTLSVPASLYMLAGSVEIKLTNPPSASGGGGETTTQFSVGLNNSLSITSVSPSNISTCNPPSENGNGVTITVRGTGFIEGMTVRLNEGLYTFPTAFISPTEIRFFISDGAVAANPAGYRLDVCRPITVGGGCSPFSPAASLYPTSPAIAAPQITGLNPAVYSPIVPVPQDITITIGGFNFANNATVTFQGTPVPAVIHSASSITITVPSSLIPRTGNFDVVVTNPPHPNCGGGGSDTYPFRVELSAPTLVSVNPTPVQQNVIAGGFTLTLTGTGFAPQSNFTITLIDGTVINLNQYLQQSSFSNTQAIFVIPTLLANRLTPHNYTIAVNNPNCNLLTGNPNSSCTATGQFVVIAAPQPQFTLTRIQANSTLVPFNIATCEWEQRNATVVLTGTEFNADCRVLFTKRGTISETEFIPSSSTPTTLTVILPFEFISAAGSYEVSVYKPRPLSEIMNGETRLFAIKPASVRFDIVYPITSDPVIISQSINRLSPNNTYPFVTVPLVTGHPDLNTNARIPYYKNNILEIEFTGTNFYPWTKVLFSKPYNINNPFPDPLANPNPNWDPLDNSKGPAFFGRDSRWGFVEMIYINCNKIIVRIANPELYNYIAPHIFAFWNPDPLLGNQDPKITPYPNRNGIKNWAELFIDKYFIPEIDGPRLRSIQQCVTPTSMQEIKRGRISWRASIDNVYPISSIQTTVSGLQFRVKKYELRLVPTNYTPFTPDPRVVRQELSRVTTTPKLNSQNTQNFGGRDNITDISFTSESFFYAGQYDIVLDYEYEFLDGAKLIDYVGGTSTVSSDNIPYINTFDDSGLELYHKSIHTKYRLRTENLQPILVGQAVTKTVEISYNNRLLGLYEFERNDITFNPTVVIPVIRDSKGSGAQLTMLWNGWYLTKDNPGIIGGAGFDGSSNFRSSVTYNGATPYNFTNVFSMNNTGQSQYSDFNFFGVGILSDNAISEASSFTLYRSDLGVNCPRTVINMEIRRPTMRVSKTSIIIGKDSEITVDCEYCIGTPTFSLGGQIATATLLSQNGYNSSYRVQIPAGITLGSKALFVENNFANPTAISSVTPFSSFPVNITVNNALAVVTSITPSEITLPASTQVAQKNAATIQSVGDVNVMLVGKDFISGIKVFVNGKAVATAYLDSTRVAAIIPATMLENPALLNITAKNVGQLPPDSTSQNQPIIFRVKTPVPVLTALSSATTTATLDSRTWTMTVTGRNFFPGARVIYNGTTLATSAVKVESATSLRVVLPDVPITAAQYSLAVVNPSPTDSASNNLTLNVVYPQPVLHATSPVSPVTTTASLSAWMITLRGGNFSENGVVTLDGRSVPFVFVNSTQIKVPMPEANTISARTHRISFANPTPGGGSTDTLSVNVLNPVPVLDSLSLTSSRAGSPVSIRLIGSRFAANASVLLNGTALTSGVTVANPTSVLVNLTSEQVRTAGNYTFVVNNPASGGGNSSGRTLRIVPAFASSVEFSRVTTAIVAGNRLSGVTLRFRDESGNLTDFDGVLRFANASGTSTGTISLRRSSLGVSTATATRFNLADTYTLRVDSVPTSTGRNSFDVVPATDFSIVVSGAPQTQVAGSVLPSFSVLYFDRLGNPTDDRLGEVRIRHDQKGFLHVLPRTQVEEGIYTTTPLQLTTSGSYSIFVTGISVSNIAGNRTLTVTPTTAVSAELMYVDSSFAAGSKQTAFRVTYRDNFGNITDGPTTVTANAATAQGTSTATIALTKHLTAGYYTAESTAFTVPGMYSLTLQGISQYSGQRTFQVTPLTAYFATITGMPQEREAGSQFTGTSIRLTDRLGNPITNNIGTVALRHSRGFYHALQTQGQANGVYLLSTMQLTTVGTYTLSVSGIASENIIGNRTTTVSQASVASATFQYVDSSFNAGGKQTTFRVTYRDNFGNLLDGPESVTALSGSSTTTISLTKVSTGVYTAAQTAFTVAGSYTMSVAGVPQHIGIRTFSVLALAANWADMSGVQANVIAGAQQGAITIRLTDIYGNRITSGIGAVNIRHERGFTHVLPTQAIGNGVYATTQPVLLTTIGTYSVNISGIGVANIIGNRSILVAAAPVASATFQSVDTLITAGSNQVAFRVTYRDAFGNLVDAAETVTASASVGAVTSTASISLTKTSLGVFTAAQTAFTRAGLYTMTIAGIQQYLGIRTFTVNPTAAASVELRGVQASIARGSAQNGITLAIADRFGNATDRNNTVLRFTRTTTNPASTGTITLTRTALGAMSAEATAFTVAGSYRLTVDGLTASSLLGTNIFTVTTAPTVALLNDKTSALTVASEVLTTQTGVASEEVVAGVPPISLMSYPNPAQSDVELIVRLPREERVIISLRDNLGRIVAIIAESTFQAGENRLRYNLSNLPNGAYHCMIESQFGRVVRPIMIAR